MPDPEALKSNHNTQIPSQNNGPPNQSEKNNIIAISMRERERENQSEKTKIQS